MPKLAKLNLSQEQILRDFETIQSSKSSQAKASSQAQKTGSDRKIEDTKSAVRLFQQLKTEILETEEILKDSQNLASSVTVKLGEI